MLLTADHDPFDRLLGDMNDVAVGQGDWADVMRGIARFLNVADSTVDLVDKRTGAVRIIVTEAVDPDRQRFYEDHIVPINPRYTLVPGAQVGEIFADRHIDPDVDAAAGEYYSWMDGFGYRYFAAVKLFDNREFMAFPSIHATRAAGPIDLSTEARYAKLLPFLSNAMLVEQALAGRSRIHDTLDEGGLHSGRACALLDCDGRVLECSAEFEAAVARSGVLVLRDRQLGAARATEHARLARLVAAATRADQYELMTPVRVQPPGSRHGLLLRAVRLDRARELFERLRPVAMLVLIDLDAPIAGISEELRLAWGLTPREADLAILIGQGCALERAAAQLGMGEGTARWHLKTIFRKMGIDRQTELAHLVTRLGS